MTGKPKVQRLAQLEAAIKRNRALGMIRQGHEYKDVVEAGIYSSTGAVANAIKEALKIARREMVEEADLYKALQVDRLNTLLSYAWPMAKNGSTAHIEQCRKLINDISDLVGAKAPVRYQLAEGDVDRLIAQLERSLPDGEAEDSLQALEGEVVDAPAGEDQPGAVPGGLPDPGSAGPGAAAVDPPDPRA